MLKPLKIVSHCEQCPLDPGFQSDPLHPRRNQGRSSVTKTLPQSFGEEWDFTSYSQKCTMLQKNPGLMFRFFFSIFAQRERLTTHHLKVMSFNWIAFPARAKTVERTGQTRNMSTTWDHFVNLSMVFLKFLQLPFCNFSAFPVVFNPVQTIPVTSSHGRVPFLLERRRVKSATKLDYSC